MTTCHCIKTTAARGAAAEVGYCGVVRARRKIKTKNDTIIIIIMYDLPLWSEKLCSGFLNKKVTFIFHRERVPSRDLSNRQLWW